MKTAVLLFADLGNFTDLTFLEEGDLLIPCGQEIGRGLDRNRCRIKYFSDYQQEIYGSGQDFNAEAVKTIEGWGEKQIGGRKLKEWLTTRGVSLWDSSYIFLHNGFFRWAVEKVFLIRHILTSEDIGRLKVIGDASAYLPYISAVAEKMGVELKLCGASAAGRKLARRPGRLHFYFVFCKRAAIILCKIVLIKAEFLIRRPPGPSRSRPDILAFTTSRRYSINLVTILKQLRQDLRVSISAVSDLWSERLDCFDKIGVDYLEMADFYTFGVYLKYLAGGLKIANALSLLRGSAGSMDYDGIMLDEEFRRFLTEACPEAFFAEAEKINLFRRILGSQSPKLIINCNDRKFVSYLAKASGIPCVSYTACTVSDLLEDGVMVCEKMMVSSRVQKDVLTARGWPSEKIEPIGELRFDSLDPENMNLLRVEYRKRKGIGKDNAVILFMSTYRHEGDDSCFSRENLVLVFKRLYEAAAQIKGGVMVTKMHPYEKDHTIHIDMAKRYKPDEFVLERDADLWQLISASDIVVDLGSAVGIDAVVLNRPLVTIMPRPYIFSDFYSLQEYGISNMVYPQDDIKGAIERALFNKDALSVFSQKRKKYMEDFLFDGKSAQRASQVIKCYMVKGVER